MVVFRIIKGNRITTLTIDALPVIVPKAKRSDLVGVVARFNTTRDMVRYVLPKILDAFGLGVVERAKKVPEDRDEE